MTENQFDDSLKNKIREHRSPVPDDMWERIIQKKDKDRTGFLFFFRWLAVLILGVCLGGYFLVNHAKQKPQQANHVSSSLNDSSGQNTSSGKDRNLNKTTPASHLNKEEVRTKENFSGVAQHLDAHRASYTSNRIPTGKKGPGSFHPRSESNDHKENFKSINDKTAVSETAVSETAVTAAAAKGIQNSASQKDSGAGGKGDSVSNATGAVNEPAPVVKPVTGKSPSDSTHKAADKKTQKDSVDNKKWYLDIYASPDWPIDQTFYPSSPFANEQMMLSFTVGLRINRSFGKHFSAKLGIQFSQINFRINADSNLYNGQVNHLKSFDLPFLVGYSFGAEKLKMTITAGGIANLYTFFKGDAFADEFKKNTGFSIYGGFNMERKINQKISIYLEPYYRYRLTSMTVSTTQNHKFIDVVGLSFGARIYFLKPKSPH